MNRSVLHVAILAFTAAMTLGAVTGTVQAAVPGSLMGDQPVKSSPSYRALNKFQGTNGDRVEIICFTYDAESAGLEWRQIRIRGTSGWGVGVVRDNPAQKIPQCGPAERADSR